MYIKKAPATVGLIPDGNRRWAVGHKLSFLNGYKLGVEKFMDFATWCNEYGVNNISVWAFSTENFKRPRLERDALFKIYKAVTTDKKLLSRLHENETRVNVVGNKSLLPRDLLKAMHNVELETKRYTERTINMLMGYGGRDDILQAAKRLVNNAVKNGARNVNEALFRTYLISNQVPDMDLVIRTSGEERLSGFMPWQSSYSELYFSKKLWPDFSRRDLRMAFTEYERRQRRFGV